MHISGCVYNKLRLIRYGVIRIRLGYYVLSYNLYSLHLQLLFCTHMRKKSGMPNLALAGLVLSEKNGRLRGFQC